MVDAVITTKQTNAVRITGRIIATGVPGFQTTESNTVTGIPSSGPNWQEAPSFFAGCFQLTDLASLVNGQ